MSDFTSVPLAGQYAKIESPRWHDGRLWFVDVHRGQVVAASEDGTAHTISDVPGRPSSFGWLPDGRIVVVDQDSARILRLEQQGFVVHADLSSDARGMLNEMWVDSSGRVYVGEMGFDPLPLLTDPDIVASLTVERMDKAIEVPAAARLYIVEVDGTYRIGANELIFPNGMTFDERTRKLFVAETFGVRLAVFDVGDDGSLTNRQQWPLGFAPDGIGWDDEGGLWVSDPIHMAVRRVGPCGVELDRIDTDQMCFACAVGGVEERTLFLCTSPTPDLESCVLEMTARIETIALATRPASQPQVF